jgi:hypothetical protein
MIKTLLANSKASTWEESILNRGSTELFSKYK